MQQEVLHCICDDYIFVKGGQQLQSIFSSNRNNNILSSVACRATKEGGVAKDIYRQIWTKPHGTGEVYVGIKRAFSDKFASLMPLKQ